MNDKVHNKNTANEEEEEEEEEDETALVLAAGARVEEQSSYETKVLKDALHSTAPKLNGIGFPNLNMLVSNYDDNPSSMKNPYDGLASINHSQKRRKLSSEELEQGGFIGNQIPHVLTVLRKIRYDLDSLELSAVESRQAQILRIKYNTLLAYLAMNTSLKSYELGIDMSRDGTLEEHRKHRLLRRNAVAPSGGDSGDVYHKKPSVSSVQRQVTSQKASERLERIKMGKDNDVLSNRVSFGKQAVDARNASLDQIRKRIEKKKLNLMQLKKDMAGESWIDPQILYEKRKERLERRRQRKCKNDTPPVEDFQAVEMSKGLSSREKNPRDTARRPPDRLFLPQIKQVYCGICNQNMHVPTSEDQDTFLSRHMQSCTGRRKIPSRVARMNRVQIKDEPTDEESNLVEIVSSSGRYVKAEEIGDEESSGDERWTGQEELDEEENSVLSENYDIIPSSRRMMDDFDEYDYEDRVDDWLDHGIGQMKRMSEKYEEDDEPGALMLDDEYEIPAWINNRLFGYQRTGLKWLWELHKQDCGGILGDEMGLGKTIQICSFLGSMASSRKLKCVLIIAPATLLNHWLTELSVWAPGLRRILLHKSGEKSTDSINRVPSKHIFKKLDKWLNIARSERMNEPIDEKDLEENDPDLFVGTGYVVLTTYENIRRYSDIWIAHKWSYVVVDEGQRIRNPDADVTIACKRLRTSNRILLSGTPIQNDLRELWSLFDFVFPGKLGTLPVFLAEFADPIKRGGYSNASPMQVQLAYRCAIVLRDMINPYLLRRQKKDIKEVSRMPGKTEHVLFCKLSTRQRRMYEAYLQSDEVQKIIRGSGKCFRQIIMLRKICNHPDLICGSDPSAYESFLRNGYVSDKDVGYSSSSDESSIFNVDRENLIERSGKLEILGKILPLWKKQGHRVLIFSQWKKMLDIIQHFMNIQGYTYARMDGNTNVGTRQSLVDSFNKDDSIFAMLLTTKTGGVGLNLTGANRIILYDPDWNPQSDAQARERAFRFGQTKSVTVYRLITAGTIEEKIYQRQIFKTAITNQILQDPRQRRMFSQKDLRDLFTLKRDISSVAKGGDGFTETGEITQGRGVLDPEDINTDELDDNKQTLDEVFKTKGIAGIFDHDVIEKPFASKSLTKNEIEMQAKKQAKKAAAALVQSLTSSEQNKFTPTWTGTVGADPKRFGGVSRSNIGIVSILGSGNGENDSYGEHSTQQKSALSSSSLLQQIQMTHNEIATGGEHATIALEKDDFAVQLMKRIKLFLKVYIEKCGKNPSTSEILEEFIDVNSSDAALFKSILKQVASVKNGHWYLKNS